MSKQYKCKTCVYCAKQGVANTADHVIGRSFFEKHARNNLPKVPACEECNRAKANLEHYLMTVMPFGARHASAKVTFTEMVPPRLARNEALLSSLSNAFDTGFISNNGGPWQLQGSLPLDGQCLSKLYALIVRGLAFHHWAVIFGDDYFVDAGYLNEIGRAEFENLIAKQASQRIVKNFGKGVFAYEVVQSFDDPGFTVWRMSLYGAQVEGNARHERISHAYAITVPKAWPTASALMDLLDSM